MARRGVAWVAVLLASLATAACPEVAPPPDPTGCSQPFTQSGPIALAWPRPRMVFQQHGGRGDVRVAGRLVGIAPGAVVARAGRSVWQRIESDATGAFDGAVPGVPTGWSSVEVRLARDPSVRASVAQVGVGNVVVLAGQSNMVMQLETRHATTLGATVLGQRRDPDDPNAFAPASDPLHDCAQTTGSIWPELADRVIADTGGTPLAFVATAVAWTGLVADGAWLPGGGAFEAMRAQVDTATAGQRCPAALLWLQGETDAFRGVSHDDYRDGLLAFAAGVEDAMACRVPIVAGVIGRVEEDVWTPAAAAEAIRQATLDALDASPDLYPGPWTYDLPIHALHFTDEAAGPLLDRWCAAVGAAPTGLRCSP